MTNDIKEFFSDKLVGKDLRKIGKAESAYAVMSKNSSVILIENVFSETAKYNVIITAKKAAGSGATTCSIYNKKTNKTIDSKDFFVTSGKEKEYGIVLSVPEGKISDLCLKLSRAKNSNGPIFIKKICIRKEYKLGPILYFVSGAQHFRVFQNFKESDDIEQYFLAPNCKKELSEEESTKNFKLKNIILADTMKEWQKIIDKIKPKIFVCGSIPNMPKLKFPKNAKRVFVSHGMMGDHFNSITEITENKKKYAERWSGCDLYCGAGKEFENFVNFLSEKNNNVLNNALPQLDILFENKNAPNMLLGKKADKYILFAGFGGLDKSDFNDHNEDYYRTAIFLGKLAERNNWFVIIKPRFVKKRDLGFVCDNELVKKYEEEYKKLYENEHVYMADRFESIYKYLFADSIIINGCSTMEIETCCIKKPLVIVRTKNIEYDPFKSVMFDVAEYVNKDTIEYLEEKILNSFYGNKLCNIDAFLKYHNITFDGKMNERAQKAIFDLLK